MKILRLLPSGVLGLCLGASLAAPLLAGTAMTLYLSPQGSDSNDGRSPLAAFATLDGARQAVRTLTGTMSGDIVVEVAKGDYPTLKTVAFDEQDSGKNGFNVIYKNQDAVGSARFIGGTLVANWTPYKDNIYQADIGQGLTFTTMYENGIRADLARWPKRTSPLATSRAGYMTFTDDSHGLAFFDSAPSPDGTIFDPTGKDFTHAWVYGWDGGDGHRWSGSTIKVDSVTSKRINAEGGYGAPDSFLIEGSLGLLTRPGEFFYDRDAGTLYYYSRFNGPMEKQEVIAPQTVRLIGLMGSSSDKPAASIQFEGLAFLGTDRIAQSSNSDWIDSAQSSWDSAIYLKNAKSIVFKNCKVADTGMSGITTDSNVDSCTITGCLIEHTGYHGISLINGSNDTLSNCIIRYAGELRGHGDGVSIMYDDKRPDGHDTSGALCKHTLSNLEIYYAARAGLAVRGMNDTIQYVKVHDCVQDSGDQGAIYLVDPCMNATLLQCTSFRNYYDLSCMDRPPTAIYNDRDAVGTSYTDIDAGDSQMNIFRHDPQSKQGGRPFVFNNVNWKLDFSPGANQSTSEPNPAFDKSQMEYDKIGVTAAFPAEYNDLTVPPVAPLNFWSQPGHLQATLHWTETDRATSYHIKRASNPGGPYQEVGSVPVPSSGPDMGTTYTDTSLRDGTTYYYVVAAAGQAGVSPLSRIETVTPSPTGSNKLEGTAIGTGGQISAAFDGKLTTYFDSSKGWVGLDLGTPNVITQIGYSPRSDNTDTTYRLCGGQFQGADNPDFNNPVTLFTVNATKGGAGTPVMIPQAIFDPTPYRYVRYVGPGGNCLVGELEFYGHPAN